jgi:hypothetical protein
MILLYHLEETSPFDGFNKGEIFLANILVPLYLLWCNFLVHFGVQIMPFFTK